MDEQTKAALDWLFAKYPEQDAIIRSYSLNMVMFMASLCAEYHAACVDAEERKP